jgi:hypothetical protein
MSSNEDEKEIARITKCVSEIFKVLENCDNTEEVFSVLASSTAIALCTFTTSGREASEVFVTFQQAVDEAMGTAIKNNLTAWVEGTAH